MDVTLISNWKLVSFITFHKSLLGSGQSFHFQFGWIADQYEKKVVEVEEAHHADSLDKKKWYFYHSLNPGLLETVTH